MKRFLCCVLLLGFGLGSPMPSLDIWNTTVQVLDITRGSAYGFLNGMNLPDAGTCFKEAQGFIKIIKQIIAMIESKSYDFRTISKIVNTLAQWFAAEWYSCGALRDFPSEFQKYISKIKENIGGYLVKVVLALATGLGEIVNNFYWFIYHNAREEYFYAGDTIGTFLYERFFEVVKP